ncbi:MAG: hypothetical protein K1060chlam5_00828 [Candidatus Anoxychlamydiales bacterium]|nr:hypothetical protein [Candidatus Anoxychlamydiales bacterium]
MTRYYSINNYLKKIFNKRVYKVSIDANLGCPNRDGKKAYGGCIYCDKNGSSSRTQEKNLSIRDQVINNILIRKTRYKAKKFICYFQSFTNTYANVDYLKKLYDEAITAHPDIVGLSISTRADSIDEEKVKLIASYRKYLPYVSIELGLQSVHDKTSILTNRHEKFTDFLKALDIINKYKLHSVAHIILGLPNETYDDMIKSADIISKLNLSGIKIHLLTALKNTILEKWYKEDKYIPMQKNKFIEIATDFIERMPKDFIIYRTSGSGYAKDIIAPTYIYDDKFQILNEINNLLIKRNSHQGKLFNIFC